jgi:AraC family transcriptional regulator of arabinose operon
MWQTAKNLSLIPILGEYDFMLSIGYVEHDLNDQFSRGTEMNFWTLEFFSAGKIKICTELGQYVYISPALALIPPRRAYQEYAIGDKIWTERYAIFDPLPHWQNWLDWPQSECGLGVLDLSDSPITDEVENTLQTALSFQLSARYNRRLLILNALEKLLVILDEVNPACGHTQRDERIEGVLKFIAAHFQEPLNLETLARRAFLSPSRFSHLFKQQTKQSPLQFLESYRLERAAEKLLRSSQSIEQISGEVGFNNAFHFSTRFRRRFGQSPSGYRRSPS